MIATTAGATERERRAVASSSVGSESGATAPEEERLQTPPGPIPPVGVEPSGARPPTASEQAYDGVSPDAQAIATGRARVAELAGTDTFASHAFHGTSSGMLDGLAHSNGRLLSSAELNRERIERVSGEGDAYGSRDPNAPQEFVSVGVGPSGMGISLAYAQAGAIQKQFNPSLYSDSELDAQRTELRFLVEHYDALKLDLESFPNGRVEKFQFQQRLTLLDAEHQRRAALPADHVARNGATNGSFPLMFELDPAGLDAKSFNQLPAGLAFAGDGGISQQVDLKTALRRVYVPASHVSEVAIRLAAILGNQSFEVVAMESLDALPADGVISRTSVATATTLEQLETGFQKFVHAYADAARNGTTIDGAYIISKVWNS